LSDSITRGYVAQILRDCADQIESTFNPISKLSNDPTGFDLAIGGTEISVHVPGGSLVPPFPI
jgi:hypothetical protein